MSREQADEPSPVVAPPHSTKRKLHVLLSQLNPTIQLEPDTEQVPILTKIRYCYVLPIILWSKSHMEHVK
jgi:hypothetical protein